MIEICLGFGIWDLIFRGALRFAWNLGIGIWGLARTS
jgi:hypothetical protein